MQGRFTGPIYLRNRPGADWITIESAALGALPTQGIRVDPGDSANMPKIWAGAGTGPAVITDPGAHQYRFVGIEITTTHYVDELVQIGSAS